MSRVHPDDQVVRVEVIVTLGDGRTGTTRFTGSDLINLRMQEETLCKQRLWELFKIAEHVANPKGPRLPPDLERVPL